VSYSAPFRDVMAGGMPHIVLTMGRTSPSNSTISSSGAVWPTAEKAIYSPIDIPWICSLRKVFVSNGSVVSGNLDVGLYTSAGVRLWSAGSTAQSGTSTEQVVDVSPDLALTPGLYYVGLVLDNTTGTVVRNTPSTQMCAVAGYYTQATAFPLPSTATFAIDYTLTYTPLVGLALEATVA
jgi:hypothetical protein